MHDQAETKVTLALGNVEQEFHLLAERGISFRALADHVLETQRVRCAVYRRFCDSLDAPSGVYPYLPIEAFKLAELVTFDVATAEEVFESSGTSGQQRSRHYVAKRAIYEQSIAA
ncbi:MAG: hypothetical protein HKN13_00475, partial [Rhodothermales bacterium]|nr:hypothetical protein [Rhodothermales bacterium]